MCINKLKYKNIYGCYIYRIVYWIFMFKFNKFLNSLIIDYIYFVGLKFIVMFRCWVLEFYGLGKFEKSFIEIMEYEYC